MSDETKSAANVTDRTDTPATPDTSIIDLEAIDESVPLTAVEAPKEHHHGKRMSKEHIQRIRRRHRRERFLFRLDMILLIIVCLGGAGTLLALQALQ